MMILEPPMDTNEHELFLKEEVYAVVGHPMKTFVSIGVHSWFLFDFLAAAPESDK
jgi:hypothetical protein